jgi:hypothetical protein
MGEGVEGKGKEHIAMIDKRTALAAAIVEAHCPD